MEFKTQEITVKTSFGDQQIEAMVGVGTGLAYHRELALGRDQSDLGWVLTQISTGAGLPCEYCATEETEAQKWLELSATITDWNADFMTTMSTLLKRGILLPDLLEAYLDRACEQETKGK